MSVRRSLKLEGGEVFHQIRVAKNTANLPKSHVIYCGVTANTWFSPLGLVNKHNKKPFKSSPLTEQLRSKIHERAKSANAVMGRKFHEVARQCVNRDEILTGKHLMSKMEEMMDKSEELRLKTDKLGVKRVGWNDLPEASARCLVRPKTSPAPGCRSKGLAMTFTGPDDAADQRRGSAPSIPRPRTSPGEIRDFLEVRHLKVANYTDSQKVTSSQDGEGKPIILGEDTISFRTFGAMKEAFAAKVVPPITTSTKPQPSAERRHGAVSTPAPPNGGDRTKFWPSRKDVHKSKHMKNPGQEDSGPQSPRGSSLRPLLYSNDCEIKHSAGCPYMCKGCFKACLASEDYIQRARKMREDREKKEKTPLRRRRKNVPPKDVPRITIDSHADGGIVTIPISDSEKGYIPGNRKTCEQRAPETLSEPQLLQAPSQGFNNP